MNRLEKSHPLVLSDEVILFEDLLPHDKYEKFKERIMHLRLFKTHGQLLWYDYKNQKPRNMVEEYVQLLSNYVDPNEELAGVEWWIRIRPSNESKSLHFDKDEAYYARDKKLRHPKFGSVCYFGSKGGSTLVLKQLADRETLEYTPVKTIEGVVATPKDNQYLLFPGHLQHGVLSNSEEDEIRITLLINWWSIKPLEENFVKDWDDIPSNNTFKGIIQPLLGLPPKNLTYKIPKKLKFSNLEL